MQKIVIISGPDGHGKAEIAAELVKDKAVLWIDFKTKSVGPIPDEKEKPLAMVIEGVADAESILQILAHYNNIDIVIITDLQDINLAQMGSLTGKEMEMVTVPGASPVVKEAESYKPCPDCGDLGWIDTDDHGGRKTCPCHLF